MEDCAVEVATGSESGKVATGFGSVAVVELDSDGTLVHVSMAVCGWAHARYSPSSSQ